MRPFLLLILLCLHAAAADVPRSDDRVESDDWFAGQLNGQPAVSLHQVAMRHPDGRRTTTADLVMVFRRKLGAVENRFEVRQSQKLVEDGEGRVVSFRLDDEQNGAPTSAVGTISGGRVRGVLHRLGRVQPIDLVVPEGVELVSDRRSQDALVKAEPAKGASRRFSSLGLVSGQVLILTMTATCDGRDGDGNWLFRVVTDQVPLPMSMVLAPKGQLQRMTLDLGVIRLDLRPSQGPVALLGAAVEAGNLVAIRGPSPRPVARNRFRLPVGAQVPADDFQNVAGRELTAAAEASPSPLNDPAPFLAAEPQLELDDPALRKWVEGLDADPAADGDERVERLRLGVRTHITRKDLAVNDGSALETYRSRRGDCTEHATLLCAALRIAGIPARIEVGLVFSPEHGAWVGHAWNSAWVKGRWLHLDSAYPGIPRSCYIKLGTTTGASVATAGGAMLANLATVLGKEVETLPEPAAAPARPLPAAAQAGTAGAVDAPVPPATAASAAAAAP